MSHLEERTVLKNEEPELFEQAENALAGSDGVVKIDGKLWRVIDLVKDQYVVLVHQPNEP